MNQIRNHYSYKIYADPQVAKSFDSERFGGSIGEFIKWNQEQVVFRELPSVEGWKIADVGAGTGRLTIPLIEKGAKITAWMHPFKCSKYSSRKLIVLTWK